MKRSSIVFMLSFTCAALLPPSALAQSVSGDAGAGRVDRRCTTSTLATDQAAPCPDDAIDDSRVAMPKVVRPPSSEPTVNDSGTVTPASAQGSPGVVGSSGGTGTVGSSGGTGTVGGTGGVGAVGTGASGAPLGVSPRAAGSP